MVLQPASKYATTSDPKCYNLQDFCYDDARGDRVMDGTTVPLECWNCVWYMLEPQRPRIADDGPWDDGDNGKRRRRGGEARHVGDPCWGRRASTLVTGVKRMLQRRSPLPEDDNGA